ncbi:Efflux pump aflT [Lachnellula cervina]|uniref:Efflux pump aflT n=1 Tax=Lachnellula cervina TaxID=1316786 RepID=A0A7D8UK39_9HELO|nr:Efflux pump aflT [Lachnellula cervina]
MSLENKERVPQEDSNFSSAPMTRDLKANEQHLKPVQSDHVYPSGLKLALLMTSIFVGMFLVALDKLIISTAIPQITNEFHAANDIGWYGTAYLLANCASLLVFGKIYTVFSIKATFLTAIVLFEVGSAICGAAPNSIAFIIGRAVAGLGGSGVQSGVIVIIVFAVPLHKRPLYQGFFGAIFGIASVLGPLVGGAFTTSVTWRWCFYINLPLGGVVIVFVFFLLHIPDRPETKIPLKDKLRQLNALGLLPLIPGVVCLCLALQWGGTTYTWGNGRIIALPVLSFVLLIAFVLIQLWKPDEATVPPRIFIQRSIASGFWVSCCVGGHQALFIYYLPVWFQAIDGNSAVESGIHILPMVLALVLASILTGILTARIGYYMPFLIFGICITAVGAGLLTTLGISTAVGQWVGYQILYGYGMGSSVQAPNMAAQTVLPRNEVSIGISVLFFGQTLFGAIFVSVGQNVLDNQLAKRLAGISSITSKQLQTAGITGLFDLISPENHTAALEAYNDSLRICFQVGLILACLSILGAAGMEWRSVKKNKGNPAPKDSESGQTTKEVESKEIAP